MVTSGSFADAHGLTCYEPNLTNSQFVAAWADTQNSHGAQAVYGPISSIVPKRSTRNFTEAANAHNHRTTSAEQHVCWQEQGRHA